MEFELNYEIYPQNTARWIGMGKSGRRRAQDVRVNFAFEASRRRDADGTVLAECSYDKLAASYGIRILTTIHEETASLSLRLLTRAPYLARTAKKMMARFNFQDGWVGSR